METRAALGAATALALTVTGGVSALFLTVGQAAGQSADAGDPAEAVTIEYVDQFGNPIDPAAAAVAPEVIILGADGMPVNQSVAVPTADAGGYVAEGEYPDHEETDHEDTEHEEDDYEDGDEEEDEAYDEGGHGYEEAYSNG